jgi:hypothetical protein
LSRPEPSDEELLAFAESLLQSVEERLRERRILEEAIQLHRATWLTLYEAASDLKTIGRADTPQAS